MANHLGNHTFEAVNKTIPFNWTGYHG
jgi:hypothetical protein